MKTSAKLWKGLYSLVLVTISLTLALGGVPAQAFAEANEDANGLVAAPLLTMQAATNWSVHAWVSSSAYGDEVTSFYPGDDAYVCFELLDSNGSLLSLDGYETYVDYEGGEGDNWVTGGNFFARMSHKADLTKCDVGTYTSTLRITLAADGETVPYTNSKSASVTFSIIQGPTYTVRYDANGGTGAPSFQTKKHGVELTLSETKPTKAGYVFVGWSPDKNKPAPSGSSGYGDIYGAGGKFTLNENTTLYAVWRATLNVTGWTGTYDGASHSVTCSVSGPSSYTLYYSTSVELNNTNYMQYGTTTKPSITYGSADVYVFLLDNTNTAWSATGKTRIVIKPRVTTNAYSGAYDGDPHSPSVTYSEGSTAYYWIEGSVSDYDLGTDWSTLDTTIPTITEIGSLNVCYLVVPSTYSQGDRKTLTVIHNTAVIRKSKGEEFNFAETIANSDLPIITGTVSATVTNPSAKSISSCTVTLSPSSYTYDGAAKTPTVTVKDGSTTLTSGTHYDVSMPSGRTNAGDYTVVINGKGSYSGTKTAQFTITQATPTLSFANASINKKVTDVSFTNTLTKATDGAVTFSSSDTGVASVNSSTGQVSINGPGTATITATAAAGKNYKAGSASYTLIVAKSVTYSVSYNANGGTGTPSTQTKQENVALTLSSVVPTKTYTISYNASGGSVSPASKSVNCSFRNWNTERNGTGTSYGSGASYSSNADATLYAQWTNPTVGALATPTRNGYDFTGWFTSASGGEQVSSSTSVTGNVTLYAHWSDPYNMGDETYSFDNYSDSDSYGGHCFGMSITSAGYHNGLIDIGRIGGNASTPLYSFSRTQIVKQPICYYQNIQGSYSSRATVAGGSYYLKGTYNISSDWQAVVDYVKNHNYDNTGLLQIGFRKNGKGGHAINFLRYENVSGQDRIYAYDNNFPSRETYFYRDPYGRVLQTPVQTFSGSIDCIALRDVRTYFDIAGDFDASHVIYMPKDAATVQGYTYSYLETEQSSVEYVMYEIPANQDKVTIIPNRDNADFIYMDTEYSFGAITDETRGELKFASMDEGAAGSDVSFTIYEADSAIPDVSLSRTSYAYDGSMHKPNVTVKVGGTTLKEPSDYSVEYPAGMKNAGKYEIKVTLKGKYSGSVIKTFTIEPAAQTIEVSDKSVESGKTVALEAKASAGGTLKYSSSNTSVASVSAAGIVSGKKAGKTNIVVTADATGNYAAATKTISVTVTEGGTAAAQTITAPGSPGGFGGSAPSQPSGPSGGFGGSGGSASPSGPSQSFDLSGSSADVGDVDHPSGSGGFAGSSELAQPLPMHRLYNPWTGEHFYTADEGERDGLVPLGWEYEGIGWTAPATSNTPVFRMYNPYAGEHHYCMTETERDALTDVGWEYEGIGWYSDDEQRTPLYREYNPYMFSCNHNYTTDSDEHAYLVSLGWVDEGFAWYGM